MSTHRCCLIGKGSPRQRRTLRRRGLRKLALNSGTTRRSAKNAEKRKKLHRRHTQHCWKLCTRLCCTTGMSTNSGDELSLRHLQQEPTPLHDHSDVHCTKKTSTTLSRYCNCGTSTVFRTTNRDVHNNGHVKNRVQELDTHATTCTTGTSTNCTTTGVSTTLSKNCTTPPATAPLPHHPGTHFGAPGRRPGLM